VAYKSKAERENERWMLDEEAIRRIQAADGCDEQTARERLRKLKNDHPAIVRQAGSPFIGSAGSITIPTLDAVPPQVSGFIIDRHWPEHRLPGTETGGSSVAVSVASPTDGSGGEQTLPLDAWVRAEVAFACFALASQSGAADVLGEVSDTLLANVDPSVLSGRPEGSDFRDDYAGFNTLNEKLRAMEKACDWAVSNCRSENLHAYLQLADSIQKVLIDSFDFINGMTIHPLRGTLTRGNDVNMENYFKLKSARTGQVWFKKIELIKAWKSNGAAEYCTAAGIAPPEPIQSQTQQDSTIGNSALGTAVLNVSVPRKRGGGRRPKYLWQPVLAKLRERLEDDGAPADGDGGQAELERFVVSQFPPDACPGESLIRERVRNEIDAFRHDLNKEGR
jgi:hypothetical protein